MKMSRFNAVPVIVQQMVESIQAKNTPEHVKYNQVIVVETIRDYCDVAIAKYKKDSAAAQIKRR
jgi:hypothetical protein